MLRSGIWEESKKPKSCLRAKRRAGQLADAQTIPAHRLTTPLRLLRSSDRFLQRRMSLLPLPQKAYLNRPLRFLPILRRTLAFVHTYPDGDRDFSFYRNPGADMMLTMDEVPDDLIRDSRIFHFGTLSSTHEGVREATRHAIEVAKEAGCIITFDPNLRPPLWKSLEDARVEIEYGLTKCDVLKISDNEVEFLFDTTDYDKGAALIEEKYHIPLVLITMGKDGSRAYYKGRRVECAPFLQEHTIETTGAGDTFCASILNYVLEHGLEDLSDENLMEMLTFANAGASLITTRKGALRVMPTREEVEEFIAKNGR